MTRNATMLIPISAALIALFVADTTHEYLVVAGFIAVSVLVWGIWRVIDGVAMRRQRRSLEP